MIWDHEAALDIPPVGSQVLVLMGAPPFRHHERGRAQSAALGQELIPLAVVIGSGRHTGWRSSGHEASVQSRIAAWLGRILTEGPTRMGRLALMVVVLG